MKNKKNKRKLGTLASSSLLLGALASLSVGANSAQAFTFNPLGTGAEVRAALGNMNMNTPKAPAELKCASKTEDDKKTSKDAKTAKKSEEAKATKASEAKCGEGKCGSKDTDKKADAKDAKQSSKATDKKADVKSADASKPVKTKLPKQNVAKVNAVLKFHL